MTTDVSSPDVVFLCLARDCATTLPGFLAFARALAAYGISNVAIVGENGSRDATRRILDQAVIEGGVRLEDTAFLATIPNRYTRLAAGREHLKQALERSDLRPRYVCVADLDSVLAAPPEPASFAAVLRLLDERQDLFAAGATSRPLFYDLIAYEDARVSYADLPRRVSAAKRNLPGYHRFVADNVYAHLPGLTRDVEVSCVSSFNGMCVYGAARYRDGSYTAHDDGEICEHLVLNRSIAKSSGRTMVVTPLLTLKTPPEHVPSGFMAFWWRRARRLLA